MRDSQPRQAQSPGTTVVLGIGNLLWADEGFGVRCVEMLQMRHEFDGDLRLIDGGTQGLYLIQHVQAADRLLIFDAVDYGVAPGKLILVADDEVPRYMGVRKMSLHQTGFAEVLALARLTGRYPASMLLVGCQPQILDDYGGSLSAPVREALEPALASALEWLARHGVHARRRDRAPAPDDIVTVDSLATDRYEAGRPAARDACRIGDERVLRMAAGLAASEPGVASHRPQGV